MKPRSPLALRHLAGVLALTFAAGVQALQINIVAGPGLAGNAPALAAFDRAAAQWESRIADPVTVTVNADLTALGAPNVIGQASSTLLIGGYDLIRNAMAVDALPEPDDAIVAALPSASGFSAVLPANLSLGGGLIGTKANMKALGFGGLDNLFGVSDGTIDFNSNFTFDFDASNGVVGMDFETVAAHELGHTLGFISMVDFVDQIIGEVVVNPGEVSPTTLDLFRFSDGPAGNPSNLAEFTSFARELRSDEEAVFDDLMNEYAMSTGQFSGDGRQASHFKDDAITGTHIGIMDPTIAFGTIFPVGEADLRTLDLIGYDIAPIPLPAPLVLCASALALLGGLSARSGRTRSRS